MTTPDRAITAESIRSELPIADRGTWPGNAFVPLLIYVGLLVALVSSLGAPLVPTIATEFHVSLGDAQWSLTITLLMGAISSPVVGRLADGPRRLPVLLTVLAAMVVGSVFAALPTHQFVLLLTGRALQGLGLSLLPLAMGLARDYLDPARSKSTLATLSVTSVVGAGLGYPLTSVIAQYVSFHAAFWLAALLGLIAIGLAASVIPTSRDRPSQHFDLTGALLLAVGLSGLLIGISEGGDWGWGSSKLIATVVISAIVMLAWVWHELASRVPVVDLRLMRSRPVLTANVTALFAGIVMYMMMSMIVRYVQTPRTMSYGLGESVVIAGLVLMPLSAMSFIASKLTIHVSRWVPAERTLPFGALAFAAALIMFAFGRDQLWQIFVEMGVAGVGVGCFFSVMPKMIDSAVPADHTSSALALNQVLRTIGYATGSALAATILTAHTSIGAKFPDNSGYTVGAGVGITLCLVTAIVSWVLSIRTGRTASSGDAAALLDANADANHLRRGSSAG